MEGATSAQFAIAVFKLTSPLDSASLTQPAGVAFIAALATLVQSHIAVKVGLLLLFLAFWGISILAGRAVRVQPWLLVFYAVLASLGLLWGVVGLMHSGNYVRGVLDAVRLYAVWSGAFLLLFTLLRCDDGLGIFHRAFVVAGIAIPIINAVGIADFAFNWGVVSAATRTEMELFVGFHDGYVRLSTINIGAMFLIAPYLMAQRVLRSEGTRIGRIETLSLVLSVLLVAVSGRRALWIVVAGAPVLILALAWLTGVLPRMRRGSRRALIGYTAVALGGGAFAATAPALVASSGGIKHLASAFSSQDERSIQKGFLLRAYAAEPLLGSGFGAYAGYVRSDDAPWTYELTYQQLLFNMGTVGTIALVALFSGFLIIVFQNLRREALGDPTGFALLIAWISLLIGAYSNPYLRSFDYLFFAGLLPFLATYGSGFRSSAREPLRATGRE